jgi:hypothetical protein
MAIFGFSFIVLAMRLLQIYRTRMQPLQPPEPFVRPERPMI